ncbi:Esterase PHB depolymerase [uncultured archaeon]|nr:Esterase PHB depolymerase [uncultured archaeon]
MRRKIIGIFVCMLMIATSVVPVMGELNILKNKEIIPLYLGNNKIWLENNTSIKFMIAGNASRAIRSYLLHVPPNYDGSKPVPLVFILDGNGGYSFLYPFAYFFRNNIEFYTNFSQKADEKGFIVVYPIQKVLLDTGFGPYVYTGKLRPFYLTYGWDFEYYPHWVFKYVDDMGFIRKLIDTMKQKFNINSSKIYVAGISDGGFMAYSVATYLSDIIAAIAPVAGSIGYGYFGEYPMYYTPPPKNPVSVIAFHGTADVNVPYDNNTSNGQWKNPSVNELIAFWVEYNGCIPTPEIWTSESGKIIRRTYTNGENATEVVLYTTVGGGHCWPGNPMDNPDSEISATNLIWEFFEAHPKQ